MTLTTTLARTAYPGTGSTGPFAFPYKIFVETDLLVTKRNVGGVESTLSWPADFTVTGVGNASGTITLTVALAVGETIVIRRQPPNTQPLSIRNQGTYFPAAIEDEFDRMAMQIIALQDKIDRSLGISESYDPALLGLRVPPGTAGQTLGWATPTQLTNQTVSAGAVVLPGQNRTVQTLSQYLANNSVFNILDYAPIVGGVPQVINTGVNDATSAMLLAVAAAAVAGGIVWLPAGIFKTTQAIYIPKWVQILGISYHGPSNTYDGISIILGSHTQAAVLSYKNSLGCRLENFTVITLAGAVPKTGIAMGRNLGLGSAGSHVVQNVNVVGYFTQAGVYMVASEENQINNLSIDIQGGGALAGLWQGQGDNLAVDTFGSSSNINNCFWNLRVASEVVDDNFVAVAIFGGAGSGDLRFFGGYLIPARGTYVYINVGNQDASSMTRQCLFYGMSGEMNIASIGPLNGYWLDGNGAYTMCVNVEGTTFKVRAGGLFLKMTAAIKLQDSRWKVPLPNAGSSYALTQFIRCDIDLGAGRFFFGDHLMGDVSRFGVSSSNTSGIFWGDPAVAASPQLRQQAANNQLQLLSSGAFYDLAVKDCWLGGAVPVKQGAGSPAGVVTAPVGSIYLRNDGGAVTTLYVKESGTGNTGWVAK